MAFEKNGGGSAIKKLVNTTSSNTVSNPVNTGSSKIGGAVINMAQKNKDAQPKQTGITPVSEVSNPVNTGSFSQSKEKAKKSGSTTTNIASDSNFAVLEPMVSNNDWERQEQERLLAEERRMAEEQRRAQEEMRRQQEEAQRLAELQRQQEEARRAKEEARRQQLQQLQQESDRAVGELQNRTEQPSAGYMPYGDPRLNPNYTAPAQNPLLQGAVSRLSRGNSSYVGNEQLDDYAAWQAQQNQNKATGLVPLAEYTPAEQSKNAFKASARASAVNDETEFYTGTPELDTDVYVTDPLAYRMNVPGLPGVGPTITTNPIELGIQNSIQEYNNSLEGDGLDNVLGPYEDRAEAAKQNEERLNRVIENTPEQYRQGYEYDYPAKLGMGLANRWNTLQYQTEVEGQRLDWIKKQPEYIGAKTDAERAAAVKELNNKYNNLVKQGDITLPEAKPIVTSPQVREAINEFFGPNSEEQIRSTEEANRLIQEARQAVLKEGINPNSPEGAKFITDYINKKNKEITPDENPFSTGTSQNNNNGKADNPVNTRPANYNMGTQTSTGDLALEASIRRGDTTYEKVYDDYVAQHKDKMGEQDARRAAYQKIYDLGYRPDVNDEASYMHYVKGMDQSLIEDLEKAMKNNYYTNDASYLDRVINMTAGGFDRSDEQNQQFYDLTSELAGNAFANSTKRTNYNTTPGYTTDEKGNPLMNSALEASMSGQLTPDQILHFYDAGYSDLVVPEEAQKWFASDSTHALQELFLNNGDNLNRLEKELGSEDELNEAVRSLINANPALKALYENGNLTPADIAYNFMKAPVDNKGDLVGSYANGGSGNKNTYFTPSYGQGGTGVKAPYKSGGYTEAELQAMGNNPYTDAYGRTQYEGYYYWNGAWYPVDQEKAAYYQKYKTYNGWDDGMRDYYNTFGTFYGYTPTWKSTGRKKSSSYSGGGKSYSYNRSGSSYNSSGSGSNSNYTNYYTPNRITNSGVSPSTANQKQNRIYNIMKNWSF